MHKEIMLIVDDHKMNRNLLAKAFLNQFEFIYAENGLEAQSYIKKYHHDITIVLLDIMMPEMDGITFLKWITASQYHDVPVIALTSEPSFQIEALKHGAWDFIVKPFQIDILQARVNNVVGRSQFQHHKITMEALEVAHKKLEQTTQQMNHLVNSIPGGIAIYRMSDHFETLYFSDGIAQLSGVTPQEYKKLIAGDAADLVYGPDKKRLMDAVNNSLKNGLTIDETCRIYHKRDKLTWVRFNGMLMEQTSDGMIIYVVVQGLAPQTKLYQSVLDQTQTAVYVCDVESYDILYFNQKMADITGVDPSSANGEKCYRYFFNRNTPCTFCHMKKMKKNAMFNREFIHPKTNRVYHMKGTLLEWNKITAHVEYVEDITEKKAAEAENIALLTQMGSIMENVPGALCLYIATNQGIEPLVHNKAFYDMFGYSTENTSLVNQQTNFLNVHPDDVEELKSKIHDAIQSTSPLNYTYRCFNDRLNEYIWIYMRSVIIDKGDGSKLCYVSYTDVSEERYKQKQIIEARNSIKQLQKQAEVSLKEYKTLVNTIPGAIVLYEIHDQIITTKFYSDGLCSLSGYTREERNAFNNQDVTSLIYPDDVSLVLKTMKQAITNKNNVDLTFRIKTKEGLPHYVHMNATITYGHPSKIEVHAVFSDIDKMKRLEVSATEQQLRYKVAAKSAGINILEYDILTDSLTIFSNSSRIRKNYYTIDNYISYSIEHNHVREDSIKTFYSIFERLRNGEKEVAEDIWYKTTDDTDWWCERMIYTNSFDNNGKPVKAFGAGRDVTREKEAIRKFQEEMHYRTAIQGNNLGSIKINLTKNLILIGESPYPPINEWIKNGDADAYFKKNAQCIPSNKHKEEYLKNFQCKALIEYFNSGEYSLSMKTTRTLDNRFVRWIQFNVHLMKSEENKDIIAFIIAHDITDEQVMKTVMETVTRTDYEFFIVVDGTIDSATDYLATQKGNLFHSHMSYEARAEELIREVVCKEDLNRVIENCKIDNVYEHIKNGDIYKFNYSALDDNGEMRRKQLQFTLIHKKRKTFLMTRIDVNEIVAEQEQIQVKMKEALKAAQSATKAKTEFLSRMSHDIRTPLNAVIGLSGLGASSHSIDEMIDYYQQIEASGKYLLSIINDVLDMSKIEGQTLVLHPSTVYIPKFIHDTIAIVQPMAEAKQIKFEVKRNGIEHNYLSFDATYVQQVVINLLSNAIKFTPDGGVIELLLENISKTKDIVKNRMIIRDNGIGISKAFLPKVFTPFEQENTSNDITRNGTGLGLSIVKRIVELMDGNIRVESKQGKGTSFIIEWDLNIADESSFIQNNTFVSQAKTSLSNRKILLCEDHPLNTTIATKLLMKQNIQVVHAENGQEAIHLFLKHSPYYFDAILMDIRMPLMDGLTATKKIRSLKRADALDIPIIAMTANAFVDDVQQSLDAGMNAHLAKPIEPQKLYNTLQTHMKDHNKKTRKS